MFIKGNLFLGTMNNLLQHFHGKICCLIFMIKFLLKRQSLICDMYKTLVPLLEYKSWSSTVMGMLICLMQKHTATFSSKESKKNKKTGHYKKLSTKTFPLVYFTHIHPRLIHFLVFSICFLLFSQSLILLYMCYIHAYLRPCLFHSHCLLAPACFLLLTLCFLVWHIDQLCMQIKL